MRSSQKLKQGGVWLRFGCLNCPRRNNSELRTPVAVLENDEHPALDILRSFRDQYLVSWSIGRTFVDWYYQIGPRLAARLEGRPFLKATIKNLIILPLARILRVFNLG
jgi:hypothetical protein